jgi:hypothetical protein
VSCRHTLKTYIGRKSINDVNSSQFFKIEFKLCSDST